MRVVREAVLTALQAIAVRFSDDAPSVDIDALVRRYSALGAWPADSQLGLLVLAWSLGPGFSLPGFAPAVNRLVPHFARAGAAIPIGKDATIVALNDIARAAFCNGSVVVHWNLYPDVLYWPLALSGYRGPEPID